MCLCFQSDVIVTQERFVLWLESHHGHTTTITDWLMDDQRLHELTNSLNDKTSDQYSIFANVTNRETTCFFFFFVK